MRGGYKVMGALSLLLFLSVCSAKQIYGEALNAVPGLQYNTLSVEYPAGFGVDESHSNSPASHNGMHCRKLLRGMMGRRTLAEEKSSSAESMSSEHSRWIARTLHHLHQAAAHIAPDLTHLAPHSRGMVAAANHDQLSGALVASSMRTLVKSNLHEANGRADEPGDPPKLQGFEMQGISRSLKSFFNSLYNKHRRNTSLLEVSEQEQSSNSDRIDGNNSSSKSADSTKSHQPSAGGTSPPHAENPYKLFSGPRSTSQASYEDEIADITGMDYSPARKKPPIHNKEP